MKKSEIKAYLAILLCVVLSFSVFAMLGCAEEVQPVGEINYIAIAYEKGLLTKADLEQIAYYNNNGTECPESPGEDVAQAIREARANDIRTNKQEPIDGAKAEGITIRNYFGCYSGSYVAKLSDEYLSHPADEPNYWEEIGGVQFHFTSYYSIYVYTIN